MFAFPGRYVRLITHSDAAHADDATAVAIALAAWPTIQSVERRSPTPAELADTETLILDVGNLFEPHCGNFDHHGSPELPCALHLLMQHLGLHEPASRHFAWYPLLTTLDCRGPAAAAAVLQVPVDVLPPLLGSLQTGLLRLFSRCDRLGPFDPLFRILFELGQDMLSALHEIPERIELLARQGEFHVWGNYRLFVHAIEDRPRLGLEAFLAGHPHEVALTVCPDPRSGGWALRRHQDHPAVDCRRLQGDPAIRFIHHSGFLAVTDGRPPLPQVLGLAQRVFPPHADL